MIDSIQSMYRHLLYSMTDCWRSVVLKQVVSYSSKFCEEEWTFLFLNVRKQMCIHDFNVVGPKSH